MTTQHGSITLIKRYSQFLSLHDKVNILFIYLKQQFLTHKINQI